MKHKEIFLLWCWDMGGRSTTTLKGAYETEEEANYYCDGLNKVNKYPHVKYYVDNFYCNTTFYFTDANGNCQVPEYKPKK
jgi:hypothetical protein